MRYFERIVGGCFALGALIAGELSQAAFIPGAASTSEARIRVRLASALTRVAIRGYDLEMDQSVLLAGGLSARPTLSRVPAHFSPESSAWEFRCQGGRVRAVATQGVRGGVSLDLAGPVTVYSPAGLIRFQGRPYREELKIYPMGSFCEVVNELGVEKYLSGLVNSEFNSKWGAQATEAQVIAARTYALHQIRVSRSDSKYDVDSTVSDQVYEGYASEDYQGSAAVRRTRGWVLLAQATGGQWEPLKAFYHSTCAGHTELPEQVWGGSFPGFKRIVACPYCAQSPRYAWHLDLSASEMEKLLIQGALATGAPPSWPRDWLKRTRAGRLVGVRGGPLSASFRRKEVSTLWRESEGSPFELQVPAARFRDWIGAARFRSTAFDVLSSRTARGETAWHFTGRGNGHGVGLCQWGAKVMGERGYSSSAILKYYYPDAVLRKMW